MPLEQAVLEHHTVGTVDTVDGPRTRVIVVAARRDMIDKLLAAARKAGLRPHGVDLSAFAMIRALHRPGTTEPVLYINVGGVTNLAVAVGPTCVFTRVVPHGVESVAGELGERRGLTMEHSHAWLKHVGLVTPLDEIEGDPEIVHEARDVLEEGIRRIADEVRNSLDFFAMQDGTGTVERAIVTGPAIAIEGFTDRLAELAGLPAEAGAIEEARPGAFGGNEPGRFAVAAGLTIEEVAP